MKEEKFLKTLALEEKFGGKSYQQQKAEEDKKKSGKSKAAIGFTYNDDSTVVPDKRGGGVGDGGGGGHESDSDSDFDLDTAINFSALSNEQRREINSLGKSFFLGRDDFTKYLEMEHMEQESAKTAKQEEEEKAAYSVHHGWFFHWPVKLIIMALQGRKSRKERRMLKERRLAGRVPSPPSYAAQDSKDKLDASDSSSESSEPSSPEINRPAKVEYITTFGEPEKKARNRKSSKSPHKKRRRKYLKFIDIIKTTYFYRKAFM